MDTGYIENIRGIESGELIKQEISDDPELQILRENLSDLPTKTPDRPNVEGIEMLTSASDRPKNEDCEAYAFPESRSGGTSLNEVIKGWEIVPLEPRAVACYFDDEGNWMHVGRVTEDENIISKWGSKGHVYKHKPELVPDHYGTTIIYFRSPQ